MTEIQYTQNNLYDMYYSYEVDNFAIAETMNAYWGNFVKTGNPSGDGLVQWDDLDTTTTTTQELGDGWGAMPLGSADQIALFNEWLPTLTAL